MNVGVLKNECQCGPKLANSLRTLVLGQLCTRSVHRVCLYACMLVCVGGGLGARARVGQHAYLYACVLYV